MSSDGAPGATFDAVEPGDELPEITVELARDYVRAHATAIGMPFPRFTDDEGAKKEGLPGQITPGNMTLALLARELLAWAPGGRIRRLGTTFRGLALAGTTVRLLGTVTEKDEERRTVECDVWMETADGDRCVIGTATVELP
jgi:acyl dehydratase